MKEMVISAVAENLPQVIDFVDEQLDNLSCPMKAKIQIDVAVEEIFINIANYAYTPGTGDALIRVEASDDPKTVMITFADHGVPYDPTAKDDPDVSLPAEQRAIGGLGIFMVKKTMDAMEYEYKDGQNILTLKKRIG